ncbi:hypothetical protein C2S51_010131 [Perilla frutescens var. frutescens]|nr:hypothetical protein C2S51_010131 [Perilla frutescens var. frutescens]
MGQDFFTELPSEMIEDILSRLPIRSIIRCKCVCKPWRNLLVTREFVKSHLSKSVACLAVSFLAYYPKPYKFFEFVDELNLDRHMPRWIMVTLFNCNLPCREPLHSSANGLLFLCTQGPSHSDLYRLQPGRVMWRRSFFICNPITREYITLPCPRESSSSKEQLQLDTYGFGVSRMNNGQYKLVRMFHQCIRGTHVPVKLAESECQVYTVGTGSWRRIGPGGRPLLYTENDVGVFLNGNLHWLAREVEGSFVWISCFDLVTEVFSTFSPPLHLRGSPTRSMVMSDLGECLCLCDKSADDVFVIWLMKEYGDDKSWTKVFVIAKMSPDDYDYIHPIKVFENGDVLMTMQMRSRLLYFCSKTKTVWNLKVFSNIETSIRVIMYTPSFVTLKTFVKENVISF